MAGQIPTETISQIRDRVDIVDIISRYMNLKKTGANHQGCCPFHNEKTPSFSVSSSRQTYKCYGCGDGGDVFKFLMKIEGLSFPEAVKKLAAEIGIQIEEKKMTSAEEKRSKERESLYKINEAAAEYFHANLMSNELGEPCRQYLNSRGYGKTTAEEFKLGYSLNDWQGLVDHLKSKGYDLELAKKVGLIKDRPNNNGQYDLFRGRLMFPIRNLSGNIVAFGGRVLDDSTPKYLNSPETEIYKKSQTLFGLHQAKQAMYQHGEALIVEGYTDKLALNRAGMKNVAATCGTALTPEHAQTLKRYANKVFMLFDQDKAGQEATFRAMSILHKEGLTTRVINLENGEDPDSFLKNKGIEGFVQQLSISRPGIDVYIDHVFNDCGPSIEGRAKAVGLAMEKIKELTNELEQDLYIQNLGARSGLDFNTLKKKLNVLNGAPESKGLVSFVAGATAPESIWTVQIDGPTDNISTGFTLREAFMPMLDAWVKWCKETGAELGMFVAENGKNIKIGKMKIGKAYVQDMGEPNAVDQNEMDQLIVEAKQILKEEANWSQVTTTFADHGYKEEIAPDGHPVYVKNILQGVGESICISSGSALPTCENDQCTVSLYDLFGNVIHVPSEYAPNQAVQIADILTDHLQNSGWPKENQIDQQLLQFLNTHLDGPGNATGYHQPVSNMGM